MLEIYVYQGCLIQRYSSLLTCALAVWGEVLERLDLLNLKPLPCSSNMALTTLNSPKKFFSVCLRISLGASPSLSSPTGGTSVRIVFSPLILPQPGTWMMPCTVNIWGMVSSHSRFLLFSAPMVTSIHPFSCLQGCMKLEFTLLM